MVSFRVGQEKVGDGSYIVISTSIFACGLSHLFCCHEVPPHLVNDSQVLPRRGRVECGTVCIANFNGEFEMLLCVVQPVHDDVELSEGVVAQR